MLIERLLVLQDATRGTVTENIDGRFTISMVHTDKEKRVE